MKKINLKVQEIILLVVVLAIDLGSKYYVQVNTSLHHNIKIIDNFLYITYAKNTGAAWSMFEGFQSVLSIVAIVAIVGLSYYLIKKTKINEKLERTALVLMIAGAAGNLIDRLMLGYVRDFINCYIFGYDFPIFNIADSALTIGVILLFIAVFMKKDTENGK